jgi:hypothetical protein
MMKLLFGILLLLGIILFGYMQWGSSLTGTAKSGQVMAELNADKIKLLALTDAKLAPGSAVSPVQQMQASAPAATSALPASATVATASASSVVAVPVHAIPPVPIPLVSAPVVKVEANVCMEWGEFSGKDLKQATQELAAMKLDDRLGQKTVEYDTGYWVYMQPLKGQAAVKKKIAQLKDLGVEDYFVVLMPDHKMHAISLGVFKTREAAENYLLLLKKKGVRTAKVDERKSKLKFTVFTLKKIDTAAVAQLEKLKKEFLNSELKTVPCK